MRAVRNVSLVLLLWLGLCLPAVVQAQTTGTCETGTASADLDVNNVRARLFNFGGLFWRGGDPIYTVPKTGNANAIFASGIWLGGRVNGELRMAAATYSNFEFWPGPLDENGNPPADCSQYDRIFTVTQEDIRQFEETGQATADLRDWPAELGAPVVDGDGVEGNYNLSGGDRPEVIGSQTAWWVMNDVGGAHGTTNTPPIGLEVQVTAFAFRRADALNNTTFYRYKLIYEGDRPLTDAFFGIWSDPDLGDATDDYVGSDPELGVGYVYNGTNHDADYGDAPPALGYDYFQGPLVNNDGRDNDDDGQVDEENERIQMSKFVYYNNDDTDQGNPVTAQDYYGYLQGVWKNGEPMTFGGTGIGGTEETDFMFPGDPASSEPYWSEVDASAQGGLQPNTEGDRRFLMSSGPFRIEPGETQEIVYGIVWAKGSSNLASVTAMKNADQLAQAAFNVDFELPDPPAAPEVTVGTFDQTVTLTWDNPPSSNNYLDSYEVVNPFIAGQPGIEDSTYTFEGYKIFRYASPQDQEGELVATYDVENGVEVVTDEAFDPETGTPITEVVARGSDSGIQHSITFRNLTNYKDYHYGVQAYAFNEASTPKVFEGPVTRVTARPSRVAPRDTGTVAATDSLDVDLTAENLGNSDGFVGARVVDPTALTGDQYEVSFFEFDPEGEAAPFVTYNIINTTTGDTLLSGREFARRTGEPAPQEENVLVAEGLSFTVTGPEPGIADIVETSFSGNPVEPPNGVWHSLNSAQTYFVSANGSGLLSRLERYAEYAAPRDFELRFSEEGSLGVFAFETGEIASAPFELWDIGVSTPDDASDDRRMIPLFFSAPGVDGTAAQWRYGVGEEGYFGFPGTDVIYWLDPAAEDSYQQFEQTLQDAGGPGSTIAFGEYAPYIDFHGGFVYPIGRFMFGDYAGGGTPPPAGTTVRVVTTKPNLPGDRFALDTEGFGVETGQEEVAEAALEDIGIVPNPYKGASEYEVASLENVARFINLPPKATIRIFTLDGTLIRTLRKEGPSNSLDWNLETEEGLPIASGIYIIHVEVPDVGEKVFKFGVVKRSPQLDVL